jgi:hypothetical protein
MMMSMVQAKGSLNFRRAASIVRCDPFLRIESGKFKGLDRRQAPAGVPRGGESEKSYREIGVQIA